MLALNKQLAAASSVQAKHQLLEQELKVYQEQLDCIGCYLPSSFVNEDGQYLEGLSVVRRLSSTVALAKSWVKAIDERALATMSMHIDLSASMRSSGGFDGAETPRSTTSATSRMSGPFAAMLEWSPSQIRDQRQFLTSTVKCLDEISAWFDILMNLVQHGGWGPIRGDSSETLRRSRLSLSAYKLLGRMKRDITPLTPIIQEIVSLLCTESGAGYRHDKPAAISALTKLESLEKSVTSLMRVYFSELDGSYDTFVPLWYQMRRRFRTFEHTTDKMLLEVERWCSQLRVPSFGILINGEGKDSSDDEDEDEYENVLDPSIESARYQRRQLVESIKSVIKRCEKRLNGVVQGKFNDETRKRMGVVTDDIDKALNDVYDMYRQFLNEAIVKACTDNNACDANMLKQELESIFSATVDATKRVGALSHEMGAEELGGLMDVSEDVFDEAIQAPWKVIGSTRLKDLEQSLSMCSRMFYHVADLADDVAKLRHDMGEKTRIIKEKEKLISDLNANMEVLESKFRMVSAIADEVHQLREDKVKNDKTQNGMLLIERV